jgi:filamentous hemagglutinin family protein
MVGQHHSYRAPRRRLLVAGLLLCGLLAARLAAQQPAGGSVVAGHATIATTPVQTTITADNNTVLRWGSFDVGTGQTVQFVQPGAEARVLNLIGGLTPSQINGSLLANGQVYLMNPAGVYFGQTAMVDVGRLYAVGGSLSKEDFFAGLNRFTGLTGEVNNAGSIRGEMVALIGRSVANTGTIVSPGGFIGLVSGDQVLLGQDGSSIFVDAGRSNPTTTPATGTAVANTGTIDAGRGTAVLAAGDFYSIAITHDGRLAGRDVRLQGQGRGDVLVSGTIDASAPGTGGHVEITGERVGLVGHASINASGPAGGGTILVGGDYQGGNAAVRNAARTFVGTDVILNANATTAGDGGKVIVWADEATRFHGTITARGGAVDGDGGLAEVSGKGWLEYRGLADLTAALGRTGTLLLDPTDITINGAGVDANPTFGSFSGGIFDGGANNTSVISIGTGGGDTNSTLLKQLAAANVVVTTTSTGVGTGNLTVSDVISYNSANSLTLTAGNTLLISSAITNAGAGDLNLNSGAGIGIGAALSTTGAVNINAGTSLAIGANVSGAAVAITNSGGAVTRSAGTITATTLTLNGSGNVALGSGRLDTNLGTLILNKTGGNVFLNDTGALAIQGSTTGNLDLTASGALSQAAGLTVGGHRRLRRRRQPHHAHRRRQRFHRRGQP